MQAPRPGTVEDGYIFVGGDPGQEANWRPVQTLTGPDAAQLNTVREAAARARTFGGYADQFLDRNRETGTGPLAFMQGWLPTKAGANIGAMNALQSRAAPMLRQAGDPSTKEMEMYKKGFPSPNNYGPANEAIVKDIRKDTSRAAARAAWLEKWGQTTGSLTGGDAAFETWWASRIAPPPGGKAGGSTAGSYSDPAKERRYQEWKKANGQ
jgi:hypothetical protein